MLKEGDHAPGFTLPDSKGNQVSLSDFAGKRVVLYFYPRDMTPGCTKEACGFRDYYTFYQDKDVVILGVSTDSQESHVTFKDKYELQFPLLSDADAKVSKAYGVYQKKKMYGKEFWGIKRTTFVINPEGVIEKIWTRVNVDTHHRDVLDTLA